MKTIPPSPNTPLDDENDDDYRGMLQKYFISRVKISFAEFFSP